MTVSSPSSSAWFHYPIRVQPHHTDYGGVVWHGNYITWLESARVECLRAVDMPFESMVDLGYDLPVIGLELRYRQPLTLGMEAVVKARLAPLKGIRLTWLYEIESVGPDPQVCVTGQVTLVTVNLGDRKVVRRLPDDLKARFQSVADAFGPST